MDNNSWYRSALKEELTHAGKRTKRNRAELFSTWFLCIHTLVLWRSVMCPIEAAIAKEDTVKCATVADHLLAQSHYFDGRVPSNPVPLRIVFPHLRY